VHVVQHHRQRRAAPAAAAVAELAGCERLDPHHQQHRPPRQQRPPPPRPARQGVDAAALEPILPPRDRGGGAEQHRADQRPRVPLCQQQHDVGPQADERVGVLPVQRQQPLALPGTQGNTAAFHGSAPKVVASATTTLGRATFCFKGSYLVATIGSP
jgi:hypothetical protein